MSTENEESQVTLVRESADEMVATMQLCTAAFEGLATKISERGAPSWMVHMCVTVALQLVGLISAVQKRYTAQDAEEKDKE